MCQYLCEAYTRYEHSAGIAQRSSEFVNREGTVCEHESKMRASEQRKDRENPETTRAFGWMEAAVSEAESHRNIKSEVRVQIWKKE